MIDDVRPGYRPDKSSRTALDEPSEAPTAKTETENFRTPDEVAAEQTLEAPVETTAEPAETAESTAATPAESNNSWREKLARLWPPTWPPGKKEYIAAAVILVLLGAGAGGWALTHHTAKVVPPPKLVVTKKAVVVKPKTVPSTLSGLPVDPTVNARPVTAVMIENSDAARPQSGLGQAAVVFEAVAEGGVTRFLALYQDTAPDNVGPVRSARPYYVQWELGFDAGYAHVGGSPDALADIKLWGVKDLDQFANGGSYHRISTRDAPHNVYTSIATLNQLETAKGYTSSTFTGFARKPEAPSKQPTASAINLTLSGPDYNARYDYVASTNSYNRAEGGAPQLDANTNLQISPKVVVALVVPKGQGALDSSGAYYSDYTVLGSGAAYIFQDGVVSTGQWTKNSSNAQITFADSAGQPLLLNPGQTWLTAVSDGGVNYTP